MAVNKANNTQLEADTRKLEERLAEIERQLKEQDETKAAKKDDEKTQMVKSEAEAEKQEARMKEVEKQLLDFWQFIISVVDSRIAVIPNTQKDDPTFYSACDLNLKALETKMSEQITLSLSEWVTTIKTRLDAMDSSYSVVNKSLKKLEQKVQTLSSDLNKP